MGDFLGWVFDWERSPIIHIAATILIAAMVLGAISLTIAMLFYGYGLVALALWIGVPLWVLIEAYRKDNH